MTDDIYSIFQRPKNPLDFEAVRISLASPEKIREWSYGEVKKPETINCRTFKPERDGLFCAKIFGPVKDWECICGKYRRIKHRGVVCDKCGVEVVQSRVRRERLGHIELASPVAHIWYLKSRPSIIGSLLDMSIKDLEKVLYFENYVVTGPGDTPLKEKELLNDDAYKKKTLEYGWRFKAGMGAEAIRELLRGLDLGALSAKLKQDIRQTRSEITKDTLGRRLRIVEEFRKSGNKPEWMTIDVIPVLPPDLRPLVPLEGGRFATSDLNDLYRRVINRNNRLKRLMELKAPSVIIKNEKRMLQEAVDALFDNGRRSTILKTTTKRLLKSLSDMIKGKQGLFRQNLLGKRVDYSGRSVIVPDPALKLHQCGLPKIMALELFKPFIFHKLEAKGFTETIKEAKSVIEEATEYRGISSFYKLFIRNDVINKEAIYDRLLELQNKELIKIINGNLNDAISRIWDSLLEKRTINGERIYMPPTFQRFFSEILKRGYVTIGRNIRKKINSRQAEVWKALEEVIQEHPVMLNRQPTLHKFNIMAFDPVLVEGKALRLHPLVCKAFCADFDGDQMAIYVPLSIESQIEARLLMSSVNNILSPPNGDPIIVPTQDIVLGIYYLTREKPDARWNGLTFSDADEVRIAYDAGVINEHTKIKVRIDGELIETTTGRVLLKEILPCGFPFSLINKTIKKDNIEKIVKYLHSEFGAQDTVKFLNQLMNLGFEYAMKSGISICVDDVIVPIWKESIIEDAKKKEGEYISTLSNGKEDNEPPILNEQKGMILEVWKKALKLLDDEVIKEFEKADSFFNSIYMMIDSGARGNWNQLSQIAGIKGLRPYSAGDIIPYVITSNYKEGLSPLECFVSATQMHQALVHVTKLTTGAGWLMRRLADVAQDIVITEDDCRTQDGIYVTAESINDMTVQSLEERIIGRISAEEIRCPETGEIFLEPDKEITEKIAKRIIESGIKKAKIRSILTCQSTFGVCTKCYGRDLARGELVEKGEAVGIIAAQSIGGPTIQSVLDTRHSNRQMSEDNTQSVLEIIRLFEGRIPKRSSINYHKILTESGLREAQLFLLNKFQSIYRLKNIVSADKHFEIIIRKMTEKVKVEDSGDTIFLRDEIVYRKVFYEENARVKYEGGRPAVGRPLILGITKTALLSDSWVSAAAFQETTKVLTTAAIAGAVDELQGLKENVIIGRLIPAGTGMPRCRNTFVKTD